MSLRPLRTYVRLNRTIGNTDKRTDDPATYEMVVPIKLKDGSFAVPNDGRLHLFYRDALKDGETVLVYKGALSWNTLRKDDKIIEMYQS
jgi:hypothetical protein